LAVSEAREEEDEEEEEEEDVCTEVTSTDTEPARLFATLEVVVLVRRAVALVVVPLEFGVVVAFVPVDRFEGLVIS